MDVWRSPLVILIASTTVMTPPQNLRPADDSTARAPNPRAALARTVRTFDFEEIIEQPYLLPIGFSEVRDRPGFPGFHTVGFSDKAAHGGAWSFFFETRGGSVAAVSDPFELPIVPGGDHLITAWVRTDGLDRARARVVAAYCNQLGAAIGETLVESELLQTNGKWRQVSVVLPGDAPDAAHIALELQLLQPAEHPQQESNPARPAIEDVSGRVWWDDVVVRQIPRVVLTTSRADEIVFAPDETRLHLSVSDLAADKLELRLRVHGADGVAQLDELMFVSGGRLDRVFSLPALPFGWFEARVDLSTGGEYLTTRRTTFLHLQRPNQATDASGFGLALDHLPVGEFGVTAELIRGTPFAPNLINVLDSHAFIDRSGVPAEAALQDFVNASRDTIFAMTGVPTALADELRIDRDHVAQAFSHHAESMMPPLEPLLIRFGQRVRRWQLGSTGNATQLGADIRSAVDQAQRQMATLVPGPAVLVPQSVHDPPAAVSQRTLVLPIGVNIASIETVLDGQLSSPVAVETLPPKRFSSSARVIDAVRRALEARRAGVTELLLLRPWEFEVQTGETVYDPVFAAWLELANTLGNARFLDELSIGPGLRCYAFDRGASVVLVAWREDAQDADSLLQIQLAEGSVTIRDVFGNERTSDPINGSHRIRLTDAPLYIVGADARLMRFRQGFRVSPASVSSAAREHAVEISLVNPWETSIHGSILIMQPTDWNFSPRRRSFSIGPGESAVLPFTLFLSRTELAGHRRIEVLVEFTAGKAYSFRLSRAIDVGLESIDMHATWRIVKSPDGTLSDVIVQAQIQNTGTAPLDLETFILAPGYRRMRRLVANLPPGESTVKSFYLHGGMNELPGRRVLIGVGEIDSTARLNRSIEIPAAAATSLGAAGE